MRILFLSWRELSYSRNRIILSILKQKHTVKVCTTHYKNCLLRIPTTFLKFIYYNLFFKKDIIFVGFFGQPFTPFVRLFTAKKIVLDAYLSMYNTLVEDRKCIKNLLLKKFIWYYELLCYKCSNLILLDTFQHINYFKKLYKANISKFRRFLIGVDDSLFNNKLIKKESKNKFNVYFHGTFIPLQGVEYIIQAAELLKKEKKISFYFIGSGITFNECRNLANKLNLKNITFLGKRDFSEIPKILKKADLGLGIFGNTTKTKLVIPNKVYELAAISIPILTSDTPAIRELFTHKKDIFLCKPADSKSLANAIIQLKNNRKLRVKIANNAYKLFQSSFSKTALATTLNDYLKLLTQV